MKYEILNSKAKKQILAMLKEQYGFEDDLDYVFLKGDNKVYISNKAVFEAPLDLMRVNSLGMYFAEIKNEDVRLSIEGSQLIGGKCSKNVILLTSEEFFNWLKGEDIKLSEEQIKLNNSGFVIVKSGDDYAGCGRIVKGELLNYVKKTRRIIIKADLKSL